MVRTWVDDTVIAPAGRSPATLVMIDEVRNLIWHGRSNVFSQIGTYLISFGGKGQQRSPITEFSGWEQSPTDFREVGSRVSGTSVWDAADPMKSLSQERENPTRVFLLNPRLTATSDPGARQGPFGSMLKNVRLAQANGPETEEELPASPRRTTVEVASAKPPQISEEPSAPITNSERATTSNPAEVAIDPATALPAMDPMNLPSMPPMVTPGSAIPTEPDIRGDLEVPKAPSLPTPPTPSPVARIEAVKPVAESTSNPGRSRTPVAPFSDEDVIHSSEQFLTMFGRLGPQGGSLRIAAGADLELPTLPIEGPGQFKIIAEQGLVRPRLRFRPPEIAPTSPSEWSVMFNLRSGSLALEGLDLIVPDLETLHADRVALAGLLRSTKLTIVNCTLSLAGRRPSASIFILKSLTESFETIVLRADPSARSRDPDPR